MREPGPAGPGAPAPIDVTPGELFSAGRFFAVGQDRLIQIARTLAAALDGCAAMAGNDESGHLFAGRYDPAAGAAMTALAACARSVGGIAVGLVASANNYRKADHHSNVRAAADPALFTLPVVAASVSIPAPPSAAGGGRDDVPALLRRFWPAGDPDRLRVAAHAWTRAGADLDELGRDFARSLAGVTDHNSAASTAAMDAFWARVGGGPAAPLTGARQACERLGAACERYARAINDARNRLQDALAVAGVGVALTSALGVLLTPVTAGGSDVAAATADAAEVAAACEPIAAEFAATVGADVEACIGADLAPTLEAAADQAPTLEAVEADTTPVSQSLDPEPSLPRPRADGQAVEATTTRAEDLTGAQRANLRRFVSKLPSRAKSARIQRLPNGHVRLSANVPATNVPGSYATYVKVIDSEGRTVSYVKDTYAPDGSIVHSKVKYP